MSISKALRYGAKLAVFTRNYKDHLSEAFRASSAEPERLIPFRGVLRWSSAAQALQQHCPIDIYFAVVDSGSGVQYAAKLQRVILDPQRGQPENRPPSQSVHFHDQPRRTLGDHRQASRNALCHQPPRASVTTISHDRTYQGFRRSAHQC